jgi:O-antigen/teichoic acid export membrane protein
MNKIDYATFLNKDILRYIPVKILPAISGLITVFFLTRVLSVNLYSDYTFLAASILLFIQLVAGWSNSSIIYFINDFKDIRSIEHFKINVIFFQLLICIIGSFGFIIVVYLAIKDYQLVILGLLLMFSQILLNLLYSFLQAERQIILQVKSSVIQSCIQIFGIFGCFYFKSENLINVFFVIFLSYFFSILFLFFSYKFKSDINYFKIKHIIDFNIAKKLFKYGLPICVWFFATQFYSTGDRIILKYYNISKLVGNYAAFRDLSVGLSGFITMPLLLASHPIIMNLGKDRGNKYQVEIILVNNIKILITLFSIVFVGLFLIGDTILLWIVGDKYLLENYLMFLVLLSIFFGTISIYLQKGLEISGKTGLMAKIAIIISFLSLLLNITFLPIYGINGACIIALFSQIIYCIWIYCYSRSIFKLSISINFLASNFLIVFISLIFRNISNEMGFSLFSNVLIFSICFFLLIFLSNEIKKYFNIKI